MFLKDVTGYFLCCVSSRRREEELARQQEAEDRWQRYEAVASPLVTWIFDKDDELKQLYMPEDIDGTEVNKLDVTDYYMSLVLTFMCRLYFSG